MSMDRRKTFALRRTYMVLGVLSVAALSQGQDQTLHFFQLGGTQLNLDRAQSIARQFNLAQGTDANGGPLPVWLMADGSVRQSFQGGIIYLNPDLPKMTKKAPELPAVQRFAEDFVGQYGLRPDDASQWEVGDFNPWSRQAAKTDVTGNIITPIVALRFQRMMDKIPCMGPNSVINVDVGAAGVEGVLANVRPVQAMTDPVVPKKPEQIEAEYLLRLSMERKLHPGNVKLLSKQLIYFEQGMRYVQPAWQFNVQITGKAGDRTLDEIIVPFAVNPPEPVQYNNFSGFPPIIPAVQMPAGTHTNTTNVKLGEYVVREDADQGICLNVANAFWSQSVIGAIGIGRSVTRTQYYWDHQWLWEDALGISDNSRYYPGAVDFAVVVAHGAPWEFSSLSNYGEYVDLHDMDHYGANVGGGGNPDFDYTSYMLFTACDMIPAPGDPHGGMYASGGPFDVWWNMFWGFHGIYGFRTMAGKQACVDAFGCFGHCAGLGHPNVATWLDATSSLSHSGGNNYAAMVLMSGYESDTIYNTTARKKATSLTLWWNHS